MAENELISVIIPTKNEKDYIEDSLISLKNQTYKNIEIVVVDDCSADGTASIAKKYADKIIVKKTNIPEAKNLGAKHAKGKILLFTDADNKLLSDWIENALENIDGCDAVIGNVHPKGEKAILVKGIYKLCLKITPLVNNISLGGIPIMVKKDIFDKVGGFNEKFASYEDVDFLNKVKRSGKIILSKKSLGLLSTRRIQKQGYLRFLLSVYGQGIYYLLKGMPYHKESYPIFR